MISDNSLSHYDIHPKFTFSVFTTMRFHYSALVEAGYNFTINRCKVPSRRCLTLVKALLRCLGWSKNRPPRRMRLPTAARSLIQRSSVSSSRPALRAIAYSWWLPRRSVVAWSYCFGWTCVPPACATGRTDALHWPPSESWRQAKHRTTDK